MPSEKLTDLQRAVIEHDDDMARLDRNTMSTPETSITVESALAELREMFPKTWAYITIQQSGDCNPQGKIDVESPTVIVQVDSDDGDIIYNEMSGSLSEAMAHVHGWKERNHYDSTS